MYVTKSGKNFIPLAPTTVAPMPVMAIHPLDLAELLHGQEDWILDPIGNVIFGGITYKQDPFIERIEGEHFIF